jgi:hypothetical protein
MSGDTSLLEPIYADDYVLVRPNGDTLGKREILDDLRRHSMRFTSFEVNDVLIRIRGNGWHSYSGRPEYGDEGWSRGENARQTTGDCFKRKK